jgi:uncharacterized protein YecT (DUF1311 family)
MPKRIVLSVFWLFGGAVCIAQNSPQFDACMAKAEAQDQMHRCASDEARRTDIQLNVTYKGVLATMSEDQTATTKLKDFERAWITYRDTYIAAMYPGPDKQRYGSITPMEIDLLSVRLTRDQIKSLTDMEQFYKDNQ